MLNFLSGLALGAAFAPFWIAMWTKAKALITTIKMDKSPKQ